MNSDVVPVRHVFRIVNGGTPSGSPENWGGDINWATPVDLAKCDGRRIAATQRSLTHDGLESGSALIPGYSLLLSSRAPIGYVSETTKPVAFNQGCKGLVAKQKVDIRYFRYQLLAMREHLQSLGQGSTFLELSSDTLASCRIRVPSLSEQRSIADRLDTATLSIEKLIARKRRLHDLLEARLIALAQDAVVGSASERTQATKIASIPVIPASWRVLRNKAFIREISKRTSDGVGEMLTVSHISGITPRSEKTVYMFEAESTVGYKIVKPGDLVINTMWAWMGAAGVSDADGIVSPAYGVYEFDPEILVPQYYDILVRTPAYIAEMTRFSRGITSSRLRLYPDEFLSLHSPVPEIGVQESILEQYSLYRRKNVAVRDKIANQIELLHRRHQAVIADAVVPPNRVSV